MAEGNGGFNFTLADDLLRGEYLRKSPIRVISADFFTAWLVHFGQNAQEVS